MTTAAYIEPQHQRIETGSRITHRYWFDGLVQCTAWAGDMDAKRWSMKSSHEENRERTKWAGTKSYEAAAKLVMKGWKKGRQQLLDNVEAIALKKDLVEMPSFLYDVAGARPEVPLAVAGDPCCMWDANPLVEAKAPTYRLFINISASCKWEAKHLMNWGACILSVVDSLEAQGNCSIEVNICQGNRGGHGRSEFIVRLKEAGQHIDFDIMAFMQGQMVWCNNLVEIYKKLYDLDFGTGGPTLALPPELNDIVQIQCSRPDRATGAPAGANGVEMFINLPPAMMDTLRRPESIERLAGTRGIR